MLGGLGRVPGNGHPYPISAYSWSPELTSELHTISDFRGEELTAISD
jgi:hypothetical protein